MSIAAALAELERSPELFDHIAYLEALVADEQQRRMKFVEDLGENTKAEFINGHVFLHPPARPDETEISSLVTALLGCFVKRQGSGQVLTGQWLIQCQRNDYMPDVCFFKAEKCAGFHEGLKVFPPPDLIVEVLSPSTGSNDRKIKWQDYARHGVGEYWIIDPGDRIVEQYVLPADAAEYRLKARFAGSGRLTSLVVTGFTVPIAALFDAQENQRVLRELLEPNPTE